MGSQRPCCRCFHLHLFCYFPGQRKPFERRSGETKRSRRRRLRRPVSRRWFSCFPLLHRTYHFRAFSLMLLVPRKLQTGQRLERVMQNPKFAWKTLQAARECILTYVDPSLEEKAGRPSMLTWFFCARYSSIFSGPCLLAQLVNRSRGALKSSNGTESPHESLTRVTAM